MHYTREKFIEDFTDLGIQKGDTLFIHSSFKSLGPVEDGAGTVIAALEAAIGTEGLILMPTFSLLPSREARVASWDVNKTPSTGGLADGVFSADVRHSSLRPLFARYCCSRERCKGVRVRPSPTRRLPIAVGSLSVGKDLRHAFTDVSPLTRRTPNSS